MGCDVNSLLGQAKKIETDLGKIRAGKNIMTWAVRGIPLYLLIQSSSTSYLQDGT
jgi:hypothetical protein